MKFILILSKAKHIDILVVPLRYKPFKIDIRYLEFEFIVNILTKDREIDAIHIDFNNIFEPKVEILLR